MAKRYAPAADLRDRAKGNMENKYGQAVIILLVFAGMTYLFSTTILYVLRGITDIFTAANVDLLISTILTACIGVVFSAFTSVLQGMLMAGIGLFYLKVACGQWPSVSDIWAGFRENPGRSFQISLGVAGAEILCFLPSSISSYFVEAYPSTAMKIVDAVLLLGGVIVYLFVFFGLTLAYFMMHDFPNLTAGQVLAECWKHLKGQRMRYLLVNLSFIPMLLLVILSFGIGIFWVWPYMMETRASFYMDMMNPKEVSSTWERTV